MTNNLNFSIQPSASVGDLQIELIVADAGITPPAGWTVMASGSIGQFNYSIIRKTITAQDFGVIFQAQLDSSVTNWATIELGLTGTGGNDGGVGKALIQNSQSLDAPSITTTKANDTLYVFYIIRGAQIITAPAGITVDLATSGQGLMSFLFGHKPLPLAGATGIQSATVPNNATGVALQVAIPSTLTVQYMGAGTS